MAELFRADYLTVEHSSLKSKKNRSISTHDTRRGGDPSRLGKARPSQSSDPAGHDSANLAGTAASARLSGRDSSPGVLYVIQSPLPDIYPPVKILPHSAQTCKRQAS